MLRRSAWVGLLLACAGCSTKRPPPVSDVIPVRDAGDSGGFMLPPPGPPPDDAGDFCGRLFLPIVIERPNLYFVVDASGSMRDAMTKPNSDGVIPLRYDAAVASIRDVLKAVGHRVNYGAALFPAFDPNTTTRTGCEPGEEVFATRPGDPVSYRISGQAGPTLESLVTLLRNRLPDGLTPTADSLTHLRDKILGLPGKTYVFLLTDGAPNCNETTPCSADRCSVNIEGGCDPNDPKLNCCDPRLGLGYVYCADFDPTMAAVASLAKSKVPTFVIGMPGTTAYADFLNRLAVAGGTSQPTEPYYYPVEGTDDLTATLQTIGLQVSVECHVTLSARPPDPARVNVYFDKRVVKQDPENGWTWGLLDGGGPQDSAVEAGADGGAGARIDIVGEACDELKRGDVIELQVVAGCPTVLK